MNKMPIWIKYIELNKKSNKLHNNININKRCDK